VTERDAFEAAPFPILVHQDGRPVYRNGATDDMLRYLGFEPEQIEVSEQVLPYVAPADLADGFLRSDRSAWCGTRSLVARDGRPHAFRASVGRTSWGDRPAVWVALLWTRDLPGAEPLRPSTAPAEPKGQNPRAGLGALTPRERQVADLVARGYATLNIATVLGIAESTVRDYVKSIFGKTGVHSRLELARRVNDLGREE